MPVKKYVLAQDVQFDADTEHSLQFVIQEAQVQVEVSAKVPVTPVQSAPQELPFKNVLFMQERQVLAVVWHVTHGLVQEAQVSEELKKPSVQLVKHYEL